MKIIQSSKYKKVKKAVTFSVFEFNEDGETGIIKLWLGEDGSNKGLIPGVVRECSCSRLNNMNVDCSICEGEKRILIPDKSKIPPESQEDVDNLYREAIKVKYNQPLSHEEDNIADYGQFLQDKYDFKTPSQYDIFQNSDVDEDYIDNAFNFFPEIHPSQLFAKNKKIIDNICMPYYEEGINKEVVNLEQRSTYIFDEIYNKVINTKIVPAIQQWIKDRTVSGQEDKLVMSQTSLEETVNGIMRYVRDVYGFDLTTQQRNYEEYNLQRFNDISNNKEQMDDDNNIIDDTDEDVKWSKSKMKIIKSESYKKLKMGQRGSWDQDFPKIRTPFTSIPKRNWSLDRMRREPESIEEMEEYYSGEDSGKDIRDNYGTRIETEGENYCSSCGYRMHGSPYDTCENCGHSLSKLKNKPLKDQDPHRPFGDTNYGF